MGVTKGGGLSQGRANHSLGDTAGESSQYRTEDKSLGVEIQGS